MPFHEWPSPLAWLAALLVALLLADALHRAGWRGDQSDRLPPSGNQPASDAAGSKPRRRQLFWAIATLAVLAARQMTVTMPGGLTLQYLGAAWLALLLGYPRAVVSMAAIYLFEFLLTGAGARPPLADGLPDRVATLALPLLLLGIAPAWLVWSIAAGCRRWLPPNLFVFLLGVGFLGLQLAYGLPILAAAALTVLFGGPTAPDYWQTMLPYALLLVAGEAWLEGILVTLLVVFAPNWVRLYDERHYLPR